MDPSGNSKLMSHSQVTDSGNLSAAYESKGARMTEKAWNRIHKSIKGPHNNNGDIKTENSS